MASLANPLKTWKCPQTPEKVSYGTFEEARAAGDRREPEEKAKLYVYACSSCGRWHLSKKNGDENVKSVGDDGLIHSTESIKPETPIRDTRFLVTSAGAKAAQEVTAALREHGHPNEVAMGDLVEWLGWENTDTNRHRARSAIRGLGWTMVGIKRMAVWYRPGHAPVADLSERKTKPDLDKVVEGIKENVEKIVGPKPTPTPKPSVRTPDESKWHTATLNPTMKSLTLEQVMATFKSIGYEMDVRVRKVEK